MKSGLQLEHYCQTRTDPAKRCPLLLLNFVTGLAQYRLAEEPPVIFRNILTLEIFRNILKLVHRVLHHDMANKNISWYSTHLKSLRLKFFITKISSQQYSHFNAFNFFIEYTRKYQLSTIIRPTRNKRVDNRTITRTLIGGGGGYTHIFMFRPKDFFSN